MTAILQIIISKAATRAQMGMSKFPVGAACHCKMAAMFSWLIFIIKTEQRLKRCGKKFGM